MKDGMWIKQEIEREKRDKEGSWKEEGGRRKDKKYKKDCD